MSGGSVLRDGYAQVQLTRPSGEVVQTILKEATASERRVLTAGLAASMTAVEVRRCVHCAEWSTRA